MVASACEACVYHTNSAQTAGARAAFVFADHMHMILT